MLTKEALKEQGYVKKRDLTPEEQKEFKIANNYFRKSAEFHQLANAHISRIVSDLVIKIGNNNFELLNDEELYVKSE